MAVVGDQGDDIDGLNQIGGKRAAECIKELVEVGGGLEQIYSNVVHDKPLFPIELQENLNKYILKIVNEESGSKIVSRNLKLVSFEVLSRFFDNPSSTEMSDKKSKVIQILNNQEIIPKDVLREGLEKSRVLFDDDDFSNLYYGI
jgi:5'-3' exonuclease